MSDKATDRRADQEAPTIHVLAGFNAEGYATRTRCGLTDLEHVPAMFPGEGLRGVHWGKPYVVKGRWCRKCARSASFPTQKTKEGD